MRVTIDAPLAVSETNRTSARRGRRRVARRRRDGDERSRRHHHLAATATARSIITRERIQIDDDSGVFAGFNPNYTVGDQLSSVTGILNYAFDNYEVMVTGAGDA